jgi:hypothetical protein
MQTSQIRSLPGLESRPFKMKAHVEIRKNLIVLI